MRINLVSNRSHPLVSALLGELLGKSGHLVRRLRDGFRDGDQLSLAATVLLGRKGNLTQLKRGNVLPGPVVTVLP